MYVLRNITQYVQPFKKWIVEGNSVGIVFW